jgi:hypothetical protein
LLKAGWIARVRAKRKRKEERRDQDAEGVVSIKQFKTVTSRELVVLAQEPQQIVLVIIITSANEKASRTTLLAPPGRRLNPLGIQRDFDCFFSERPILAEAARCRQSYIEIIFFGIALSNLIYPRTNIKTFQNAR